NRKKISTSACKVLDAPGMKDDFYVHLLDWSCTDYLAVGLGCDAYVWNACNSEVERLNTWDTEITSLNWLCDGQKLAIGFISGKVEVYDYSTGKCINSYFSHSDRVGVLAQ